MKQDMPEPLSTLSHPVISRNLSLPHISLFLTEINLPLSG